MKLLLITVLAFCLTPQLAWAGDQRELCDKIKHSQVVAEVEFTNPHRFLPKELKEGQKPTDDELLLLKSSGRILNLLKNTGPISELKNYPAHFPTPFAFADPQKFKELFSRRSFRMLVFLAQRPSSHSPQTLEWGPTGYAEEFFACEASAHYSFCQNYPAFLEKAQKCVSDHSYQNKRVLDHSTATLFFHLKDNSVLEWGIGVELEKNWHTYWLNPGNSGLAPTLKIESTTYPLTQKDASPIFMPAPTRKKNFKSQNFIFENKTFFYKTMNFSNSKPAKDTLFEVTAEYLVCLDQCVKQKAHFTFAPFQELQTNNSFALEKEKFIWPESWPSDFKPVAILKNQKLLLKIPTLPSIELWTDFFPSTQTQTDGTEPLVAYSQNTAEFLLLPLDFNSINRLNGLVIGQNQSTLKPVAFWIDEPLKQK